MGEAKRKRRAGVAPPAAPDRTPNVVQTRLIYLDAALLAAISDRLGKVNARRAKDGQLDGERKPLTWNTFVVYVLAKRGLELLDVHLAQLEASERMVKTPAEVQAESATRLTAPSPLVRARP